jgi:outer membrane immunogenic protein
MSRVRILGASLVALMVATGAASAADLYNPPPAASPGPLYSPQPAYSWNGSYVGLFGGYGWGSPSVGGTSFSADDWQGGLYAGYNFQTDPNWVVGVEGDVSITGMSGTSGGYTVKNPWDSTLRLRAGYAANGMLFYGTGGLAVGQIKATDSVPVTQSATKVGWTAGAGIEAMITSSMSARAEFRHTDLGSTTMSSLTGAPSVGFSSNSVLVGVGMKF